MSVKEVFQNPIELIIQHFNNVIDLFMFPAIFSCH